MEDPGKITLGSQNHIAIHGAVVTQQQSISIDPHVDPITAQVLRQQINLAFDLLDRVFNRLHVDIAGIGSLELFPFVVVLAAAKLPHVVLHFNNEHAILVYYYIVQLRGPSFVLEGDVGQQDVPFLQMLAQQKRRAGLPAFPGKLLRGTPCVGGLDLRANRAATRVKPAMTATAKKLMKKEIDSLGIIMIVRSIQKPAAASPTAIIVQCRSENQWRRRKGFLGSDKMVA